jgi:tRNA1(Val) A37 N6-methylase TrmN6
MNKIKVKLPFTDTEIEQLESGHPVTEASAFLQETIVVNTPEKELKGLELGSGFGIVSFMLALQRPQWDLEGIELVKELTDLAADNNLKLGLNCRFITGDIRDHRSLLRYKDYGLVFSNPPWCKKGSGKLSPDPLKNAARHETTCRMRDIMVCIDWCLNETGTAWTVYPLERKEDLPKAMIGTNLEVSELIKSQEYPKLFIAKLRRKPVSNHW